MRKDELALQIDSLWDLGRRSYDDLKDAELDVLTALLIQQSKNPLDYLNDDVLPRHVARYLLERNSSNMLDIVSSAASLAVIAAEKEINKLLEARAELEAYYNPEREPSELEVMVATHNRNVAADMNHQLRSQIC